MTYWLTPEDVRELRGLGLSPRTATALVRYGEIRTVDALTAMTPEDVQDIRNIGPAAMAEIRQALATAGRALAPSNPRMYLKGLGYVRQSELTGELAPGSLSD